MSSLDVYWFSYNGEDYFWCDMLRMKEALLNLREMDQQKLAVNFCIVTVN